MKFRYKISSIISSVFALLLTGQVTSGYAASYQGLVQNVAPFNGKVYIVVASGFFDGAGSACAKSGTSMLYVIDPSTPFGRVLVATALSAKVSGRLVYAIGTSAGGCDGGSPFGGGAETLQGLDLKG